jgi:dihydroorotate dehydrogenase (fumarate)
MIDLSCTYLGLNLRNPLVVGSSGLTSSIEKLITLEKMGAGAVVLKSIFEEQIKFETDKLQQSDANEIKPWKNAFDELVSSKEFYYEEAFMYITDYAKNHSLNKYLAFISEAKKKIKIPVIASINCSTQYDWQYFARRIQDSGADALELNIYLLPSDFNKSGNDNEKVYFDIIHEVKKYVSIPVSLKTGFYFSSLANFLYKLSETGISGLTLFNRPYNPDIDIDMLQISSSNFYSSENEYSRTLRWVAILSGRLKCDIAASTGIHNHKTIIKQLLAGADAVQMASVFYKKHFDILPQMISEIKSWMKMHAFSSISDFKGKLSQKNIENPAFYERVQFIKLFSSIE